MRLALVSLISLTLISCGVKIKNFNEYQKSSFSQVQNLPTTEQMSNSIPRVTFATSDDNTDAANIVKTQVIKMLSDDKLISVVSRPQNTKAKEEIKLSQAMSSKLSDVITADYLVQIDVSSMTFDSSFIEERYTSDSKGNLTLKPAHYEYNTSFIGSLTINSLPGMENVASIALSGNSVKSEDANVQQGFFHRKVGEGKKFDSALANDAILNALINAKSQIKNLFAKSGYVLEKRINKNKSIFQISLGSNDGIKEGDILEIFETKITTNPITAKEESEIIKIATAKVSDQITPSKSWIVVNKKEENAVKLGSKVKVIYKKKFSDMVESAKTSGVISNTLRSM